MAITATPVFSYEVPDVFLLNAINYCKMAEATYLIKSQGL